MADLSLNPFPKGKGLLSRAPKGPGVGREMAPPLLLSVDLIKKLLYNVDMDIFQALAEPTRRKIIEILAERGQLSATEICEQFQVTPQAISQHLKILREAKLVQVEKRAQQRIYSVNAQAVQEIEDWARQMTELWNQRFYALDKILKSEKEQENEQE